ncbi:hypothetical protein HRbin34_00391 [bacterium HR34]|nr:hypothetical protein HRbin34_00391 [bacterium HR34]
MVVNKSSIMSAFISFLSSSLPVVLVLIRGASVSSALYIGKEKKVYGISLLKDKHFQKTFARSILIFLIFYLIFEIIWEVFG